MFQIPAKADSDIQPGTYKAQLASVTDKSGGSFGDGNYRVWDFMVEVPGKEDLVPVSGLTSQNNGPKTTSYAWLTALLGEAPLAGKSYEVPTGKTVLLTIELKDNGFPKIAAVSPFVDPQQTMPGVPR